MLNFYCSAPGIDKCNGNFDELKSKIFRDYLNIVFKNHSIYEEEYDGTRWSSNTCFASIPIELKLYNDKMVSHKP